MKLTIPALVLAICLTLLGSGVAAQLAALPSGDQTSTVLEQAATELSAISDSIRANRDTQDLQALRVRINTTQRAIEEVTAQLEPALAKVDDQLQQLGPPVDGEDQDIVEQRGQLRLQRAEFDSALKRAHLVSANAANMVEAINRVLSEEFNRNALEQVASPLSISFWNSVNLSITDDTRRLMRILHRAIVPEKSISGFVWGALALAIAATIAAAFLIHRKVESIGLHLVKSYAPETRFRRSGLALWLTVFNTLTATAATVLISQLLRWIGFFDGEDLPSLLATVTATACFACFVVALGRAILLVEWQSWRLIPLDDETANALRYYPHMAAVILAGGVGFVETNRVAGISPAGAVLSNLIIALCYVALVYAVLRTLKALMRNHIQDASPDERESRPWLVVASFALWLALVISVVALALGYVNLGLVVGRQIAWMTTIVASLYVVVLAVDDGLSVVFSSRSNLATYAHDQLNIRVSTVEQCGIVLSAIIRILVLFSAFVLFFVPFGPGTGVLFAGVGDVSTLSFWGVTIEAAAIARACAVLLLALLGIRFAMNWLEGTYLPSTELDSGTRNSAILIAKYTGFIAAGLWTVNTLGVGVERIALVVSALSVGIGFGLQAIIQNFISGIILLAERPLKIGDTVRVGADEGDVKRISVRTTEIEMGDRSTLIVPNSELVTKTIRNMTPPVPATRIEISFNVPITVVPEKVREIVSDLFRDHEGILSKPKAEILIDAIADGKIFFRAFAFVSSPKGAAAIKSSFLFALLQRFREDSIELGC